MANIIRVGGGASKVLKVFQYRTGSQTASDVLDTGSTEEKTVYYSITANHGGATWTAYGYIQGSDDNSTWNNIYTFSATNGISINQSSLTSSYRYLRIRNDRLGGGSWGMLATLGDE